MVGCVGKTFLDYIATMRLSLTPFAVLPNQLDWQKLSKIIHSQDHGQHLTNHVPLFVMIHYYHDSIHHKYVPLVIALFSALMVGTQFCIIVVSNQLNIMCKLCNIYIYASSIPQANINETLKESGRSCNDFTGYCDSEGM